MACRTSLANHRHPPGYLAETYPQIAGACRAMRIKRGFTGTFFAMSWPGWRCTPPACFEDGIAALRTQNQEHTPDPKGNRLGRGRVIGLCGTPHLPSFLRKHEGGRMSPTNKKSLDNREANFLVIPPPQAADVLIG